jgi:hypothetical protein
MVSRIASLCPKARATSGVSTTPGNTQFKRKWVGANLSAPRASPTTPCLACRVPHSAFSMKITRAKLTPCVGRAGMARRASELHHREFRHHLLLNVVLRETSARPAWRRSAPRPVALAPYPYSPRHDWFRAALRRRTASAQPRPCRASS